MASDEAKQRRRDKQREYMRQRRLDPRVLAVEAEKMRERRQQIETRARERIAKREYERRRYAEDPEYRERELARKNALRAKARVDREYRERERQRSNRSRHAKYATDPEYRQDKLSKRRAAYAKNSAPQIAASKRSYQKLREQIYSAYGNRCSCCGETESLFLELDHVNGDGQHHRNHVGSVAGSYRDIIMRGFPDAYRLLCCNCNRGRQRNGGICPHQVAREAARA